MLSLRARITYIAHLFKAIFKQKHQELIPLTAPYLDDKAVIIDVGAHCGQISKLFCKYFPNGHIYAFEPGSYAWSILSKMQLFHRYKNLTITHQGLSDKAQTQILHIPIKQSGSIGFGLSSLGTHQSTYFDDMIHEEISLTTLDNFAKQHGITKIDFIKIDIEGHEMHMLQGAEQILKRDKPVIYMECDDNMLISHGYQTKDIFDYLAQFDYDIIHQDSVNYLMVAKD